MLLDVGTNLPRHGGEALDVVLDVSLPPEMGTFAYSSGHDLPVHEGGGITSRAMNKDLDEMDFYNLLLVGVVGDVELGGAEVKKGIVGGH